MKHQMKKTLALLMALVMVLSALPMAAFAEEMEEEIELFSEFDAMPEQLESEEIPQVQTNENQPIQFVKKPTAYLNKGENLESSSEVDEFLVQEAELESAEVRALYGAFPSESAKVRNAMKNRQASITLEFNTFDISCMQDNGKALWSAVLNDAFAHTGVPTEGDYLYANYDDISGLSRVTYDYPYTALLTYDFTYFDSASKEATVTNKVNSIVNGLGLQNKSNDYEKVKAIYDYMSSEISCNFSKYGCFVYDLLVDGAGGNDWGFAGLFYRLALEAGLDARIVTGKFEGYDDVWNIVRVGSKYYNVDPLAGAVTDSYSYFLKSNSGFSTYTRDSKYNSADFNNTYPMAASNFSPCKTHHYSAGICTNCGAKDSSHLEGMYRLYNPYTLEHMFNSNASEREKLQRLGWSLDGFAFYAPTNGTKPVYRLYNRAGDWHSYSADSVEIANLQNQGWTVDGIMCYSADSSGKPVFRLYNPYESINFLLFTSGVEERDKLVSLGWVYQGIAWYVIP